MEGKSGKGGREEKREGRREKGRKKGRGEDVPRSRTGGRKARRPCFSLGLGTRCTRSLGSVSPAGRRGRREEGREGEEESVSPDVVRMERGIVKKERKKGRKGGREGGRKEGRKEGVE